MRIKELRMGRGIRQVDFAASMGVSQGTVSDWEQETYLPKTRQLPLLARVLGCTISDLFLPLDEAAC